MPKIEEIEGDKNGWHIRLVNRLSTMACETPMGSIPSITAEIWALYFGETPRSSPTTKVLAKQWMDEELAKVTNG